MPGLNEKEIQILSELRSEYNCFDPSERKYYHALSEAISSLKNNRHGHWLAVKGWDDDLGELDSAECSVCHETQESEYWAKTYYKYCPNCGADMRGRENDYADPNLYPCRGCEDYDGQGGCLSNGGWAERKEDGNS